MSNKNIRLVLVEKQPSLIVQEFLKNCNNILRFNYSLSTKEVLKISNMNLEEFADYYENNLFHERHYNNVLNGNA